jgi:hypothetical protein
VVKRFGHGRETAGHRERIHEERVVTDRESGVETADGSKGVRSEQAMVIG